jgi:hypothetical protein
MASKKTFKDSLENPAELFISKPVEAPAETKEQETPATAPKGYRVNPLYIETKSKRLQLLVQPSLLDKLKGKAKAEGRSVNDLVHSILEEALRGE